MWWLIILFAIALGAWKTRFWLKLLLKSMLSSPRLSTLTIVNIGGEQLYRVPYFHDGKWGTFEIEGITIPQGWDITIRDPEREPIPLLRTRNGGSRYLYGVPRQAINRGLTVTAHPIPDKGDSSSHKSVTLMMNRRIDWITVLTELCESKQTGAQCLMEACD